MVMSTKQDILQLPNCIRSPELHSFFRGKVWFYCIQRQRGHEENLCQFTNNTKQQKLPKCCIYSFLCISFLGQAHQIAILNAFSCSPSWIYSYVSATKDASKNREGVIWVLFHGAGVVAVPVVAGHMRSWPVCLRWTPGGWETALWNEKGIKWFFSLIWQKWFERE